MKRYYFLLLVSGALVTACTKLDQVPQATASREAVFSSEKGLEVYANSFYDILPDANAIIRSDEMSDYGARSQAPDFLRDGSFGPRQSSGWDWKPLRNINYFLENNNNANVPADVRTHYNALARFFRAVFYFEKVKRFGNVPWISRTMRIDDPSLFNGRDSRKVVMDSVLDDLNYAVANLRATDDKTRSLITRNVAYAFKSRICLFEGTFRKYHNTDVFAKDLGATAIDWLKEAASAADKIITGGSYSLNSGGLLSSAYRTLFISQKPVANEVILAAVVDPALGVFNDANWWWTSATYGARLSFTRDFVNTYLNIDGTPFTGKAGYETMVFADEVKNRDLRLQQTIRMGDYKRTNGGKPEVAPPVFSYTYTGYQPIKFCLDDVYFDGGSRNDNSIPMIRYAEVLLNYAEAKAELETLGEGSFSDADWAKTIGALRQRAGITGGLTAKPVAADPYLTTVYYPGLSAVLSEIRRERGIELAFEGFRFYDLMRWKLGKLLTKTWNGFYVPAIDVPMDLNGDNIMDVSFYIVEPPKEAQLKGVTYINVAEKLPKGELNPQRLSEGTKGQLIWLNNISRSWDEEKNYLYPIPEADLLMNPKLGQNPKW
ncbi:RagB/SusD family nutrient uptake outer membrane protein [Pseudoflavitalea sp. G-6-1-2]|uniref:RagB/SusD family nutrient uptake outer membrane protein n=1 Tax=Pseudoflavitalea sp. G-6-1-2 TaxID=2728841 RepID=UPI00146D34AA|nr:RagB/SusD family nutrient uptake outer membrane protein [Pseudoflavitalea sp. G-6-1-2]NML22325.1 RagB/SusD family nutrient uptake outer membrane protein [Pseudoflavitalea sp. G-6-1-2]